MKWWYENEEEEMKLYKNEDLCIECKNEFFSKPYDHRDPTPGQLGYCIKCDNCLIKEKKMEFLRERVYTALNADELKAGDKVIVGDTIMELRDFIEEKAGAMKCYAIIKEILPDNREKRFAIDDNMRYPLAYLVERKENCTNCGAIYTCAFQVREHPELEKCKNWKPKTEQKAEKHYRPFKDTDELIKVFWEKTPKIYDKDDEKLFMPYIWVREKGCGKSAGLITCYGSKGITVSGKGMYFDTLFTMFEFLDGSPCGVEE